MREQTNCMLDSLSWAAVVGGHTWDDWPRNVIGYNFSNTRTQVDPLEPRIKFGTPETHKLCTYASSTIATAFYYQRKTPQAHSYSRERKFTVHILLHNAAQMALTGRAKR